MSAGCSIVPHQNNICQRPRTRRKGMSAYQSGYTAVHQQRSMTSHDRPQDDAGNADRRTQTTMADQDQANKILRS
ncbi:uncharacterized protein PHACADRAFT_252794 [Phanerochaete carnosa HHB-10118-sp]|uniref:Uncharacterized protein n=1 Tax=Phanerochaete carnosa (strain HHB-10118-sp) TaxID=650164 RepID=K5WH77_PHACS|nr:uncharacterized protein PHACADRAFT_252794 [Phanerochaete carnosa HHB-10118-sp]EKM58459.1 hypothetical protein PHACADRAFT_252794 [Phanerochaete carnosa HHB-10118-sp]